MNERNPSIRAPRPGTVALAARVIERSSRENPADALLREELRAMPLSPEAGSQAAAMVFEFFRWRAWIDTSERLPTQIRAGRELAAQFAENPRSFPDQELMDRTVPSWIKKELKVSPAFARALQTPPVIWVRTRKGTGRSVAAALGNARAFGQGILGDTLLYSGTEDLFRTPGFQEGAFEIQDIGSQAVGFVCAPGKGETWWDCCAGEGGKTLHLSDLMANSGLIWATDRAEWRLRKLKKRAARAKVFNYRLADWDGGERLPTRTMFDGVLVDAPCSGVGTWQRNPHARWTLTAQDVAELGQVQTSLLLHAARAVKPGGRLVYAVCTLTRAETNTVCEAFQRACPNFEPQPISNPLKPGTEPTPHLWLWPQNTQGNGMFIAAWRRVA